SSLDRSGMKFRWPVPRWNKEADASLSSKNVDMEVTVGRRMQVKFRQPFMAKGYYVETEASITTVSREVLDNGTDEALLTIKFENAKPADLDLIGQYMADMAALKAEVDQARTKPA